MVGMESRKLNSSAEGGRGPQSGRRQWSTWSARCRERWRKATGRDRSRWLAAGSSPPHEWCSLRGGSLQASIDPHHDAAHEQRDGHGVQAAQVLFAPFVQQKRGNRGACEGDERERDGMVEPVAVAVFAFGKGAKEVRRSAPGTSRQSARMAPTWMTIVYIPVRDIRSTRCRRHADSSGIFISASAMRRCAVELTGKNSVKPSTIPKRMDRMYGLKKPPGLLLYQSGIAARARGRETLNPGRCRRQERLHPICTPERRPARCSRSRQNGLSVARPRCAPGCGRRCSSCRRRRRRTCP